MRGVSQTKGESEVMEGGIGGWGWGWGECRKNVSPYFWIYIVTFLSHCAVSAGLANSQEQQQRMANQQQLNQLSVQVCIHASFDSVFFLCGSVQCYC